LAHRELQGVESLGVDEIHWGHGRRANNLEIRKAPFANRNTMW